MIGAATGGGDQFGGTEPVGGRLEVFVPLDEAVRRIAATARSG